MNQDITAGGVGRSAPVRALRRVLAPAALELQGQLPGLRAELARMADAVRDLRAENADLRRRVEAVEAAPALRDGLESLQADLAEVRDGLHQERRLQLRVAELVDLVAELVLPLHNREISPDQLDRLRPDAS